MPTQLCDPETQLMEFAIQLDTVIPELGEFSAEDFTGSGGRLVDQDPEVAAIEQFTVEDIQGTGDVFGAFRATERTRSLLGRRPGTVAGAPEAWFTACCCCCCCSAAT
jgi:hypothetical protein